LIEGTRVDLLYKGKALFSAKEFSVSGNNPLLQQIMLRNLLSFGPDTRPLDLRALNAG
jgi:hypothetical protein